MFWDAGSRCANTAQDASRKMAILRSEAQQAKILAPIDRVLQPESTRIFDRFLEANLKGTAEMLKSAHAFKTAIG